jgi:predicted AlkP superfamily phosphohydrolase/phosphomutase
MSHHPRILFLGLDAMDRDLILEWANVGILPTFRSLLEQGTFGPTRNPPGLFVGAIWPSFFTGVSPAQHGRYCYEQIVPGTYDIRHFRTSDLKRQPFWKALSNAGRRVAIVDVPKSPLTSHLNGIQLKDWGTHDRDAGDTFQAWPPPLAAELTARFGSDVVGDCNDIGRTTSDIEAFCRQLTARVETKTAICRHLLEQEDWDLFLAVFTESHCVGHQCWVLHDQTHPAHDRALAEVVGDPLRRVYTALDTAVAELLLKAGPDTTVFVLASHGMGPHFDATFMLDDILKRLDPPPGEWTAEAMAWGRRHWRDLTHRFLRRPWRRVRPPVGHRRCFTVPNNDVYGGIRVNLVGREPRGRVRRGKEYDELFAQLREGLLELVNVHTGQPIVREVLRSTDLYRGDGVDDLPDFLVEWNRESPITCVASPRIGTISKSFSGVRNGDHKPDGFFWAVGPGIEAGRRIDPVSVMDFAPTVAARLGIPLADVEGEPIAAVLPSSVASV